MRPAAGLPAAALLALLACPRAHAAAQDPARATPAGASALPALVTARVDSLFARFDRRGVPGCAVGVVRAGALAYAKGYGTASLDYGIPLSPRSAFYVASLAKQFTAAAVALLVEEGKLAYATEVRTLLPELPTYMAGVTIEQLLHHTSGVRDYLVLFSLAGVRVDGTYGEAEMLAALQHQRGLGFAPGERYSYSNTGYVILGMVVRRVSGQSLREFARTRLFAPLGMSQTGFHDDHAEPVPDRAVGYEPHVPEGLTITRMPTGPAGWRVSMPASDLVGDAGVYSSIEDMARWESALQRGAVRDSGFAARLAVPGRLRTGEPVSYAHGLSLGELHGHRRVGHGGAFGGYRAELLRLPDQRLSVLVLCNTTVAGASRLAQQVAELVLGDSLSGAAVMQAGRRPRLPQLAVPVSAEVLAGWAGIYRDPTTNLLRGIAVSEDGSLVYARGPGMPLVPRSAREFDVPGLETHITFVAPAGGAPVRMTVMEDDGETTYERLPGTPPPPERLAEFAGLYVGEDGSTTLEVRLHSGTTPHLSLRFANGGVMPLVVGPDDLLLASDFAALRFERDRTRGRITGFLLDADRANGIRFVRR